MNVICDNLVEKNLYSNNFDAGHNEEIFLRFLYTSM